MTPSQLKAKYLKNNPDGHFFSKGAMQSFGDTMKNFGCRKARVVKDKEERDAYVIYRKRRVRPKHDCLTWLTHGGSWYFDATSFKLIHCAREI